MTRPSIARIFATLCAGIIFLILVAPTLISVPSIRSFLFYSTKKISGYEVECAAASFGWTTGVEVESLRIWHPNKQIQVEVGHFAMPKPLYSFLVKPSQLGDITIENLHMIALHAPQSTFMSPSQLAQYSQNQSQQEHTPFSLANTQGKDIQGKDTQENRPQWSRPQETHVPIEKSIQEKKEDAYIPTDDTKHSQSNFILPPLDTVIHITHSAMTFMQDAALYTTIDNINATLTASSSSDVSQILFSLDANALSHGDSSTEVFAAPITIELQLQGRELFKDVEGKLTAQFQQIPSPFVQGISSLLFPKVLPLIQPLLGKQCSIELHGTVFSKKIDVATSILSSNLRSNFHATVTPDEVRISKAKLINVTCSEHLFNSVIKQIAAQSDDAAHTHFVLQEPVTCVVALEDEAIYSLLSHTFLKPITMKGYHSPAFVIQKQDRKDRNGTSQPTIDRKKAFSFICSANIYGDTQGEKVQLTVLQTDCAKENAKKAELHFSLFTHNTDRGKDFTGEIAIHGLIPKIIQEHNIATLPISTLFGNTFEHSMSLSGTFNRYNNSILYQGNTKTNFERSSSAMSFSGTEKDICISNANSKIFIPYSHIEKIYALVPQEDISYLPQAGITATSTIKQATIPFSASFFSLQNAAIEAYCDIFFDPITSSKLHFALAKPSSAIKAMIRKEKDTNSIDITSTLAAPIENAAFLVSAEQSKDGSQALHSTSLLGSFAATALIQKESVQCSVSTISVNIEHILSAHLHNACCLFEFASYKDLNSAFCTVTCPSPLCVTVHGNRLDLASYGVKNMPFLLHSTAQLAQPLVIAHQNSITSGVIDTKVDVALGANRTHTIVVPCTIDFSKKSLQGEARVEEKAGQNLQNVIASSTFCFEARKSLQDMRTSLLNSAVGTIDIHVNKPVSFDLFPFELFQGYFHKDISFRVRQLCGSQLKKLNLSAAFHGMTSSENSFSLACETERAQLQSHLVQENNSLISSPGVPFLTASATLSSDTVKAIFPNTKTALATQSQAHISITDAALPISLYSCNSFSDVMLAMKEVQASFAITTDTCNFISQKKQSAQSQQQNQFQLAPFLATGSIKGSSGVVDVQLTSKRSTEEYAANIDATFSAHFPFGDTKIKSPIECIRKAIVDSHITLDSLNPVFLSRLTGDDSESLKELLGSDATAKAEIHLFDGINGTIQTSFQSKNCNANCTGRIVDGVFIPSRSIEGSVIVTQKTGELILKNVNPFLATAVRSQKPLTLTIPQDGVAIPLIPFSCENIVIPKGSFIIDTIQVKNGGALKMLLAALRAEKNIKENIVDVWCTPIYFSIKKGLFTCNRADFLVGKELQLALWGSVNMKKDSVAMSILVPNKTLHTLGFHALSSQGLTFPITGTTANAKIDMTRLTAKLAAIGIRSSTANPTTQIISGLIEAVASVGEENSDAPQPTTVPFPWEKEKVSQPSKKEENKK